MKKRILSAAIVICLLLTLLPASAWADDKMPEWKYQESPTPVGTYDELVSVLHSGEIEPDENNVIWIPVAELTKDLELTSGQDVSTLGKLVVPSGVTLTVNSYFEAETEILSGGVVTVRDGGYFGTTMGGDTVNNGTITVERGGTMQSTMGASIVNAITGRIQLDGTFYCGCVHYDDMDHLWFQNVNPTSDAITGNGDLIIYEAGMFSEIDLDDMIGKVMDMLGQSSRFENWDDVNVYRQIQVDSFDLLNELYSCERTVKNEPVEGNMDTIIVMSGDVTIPEDASLSGMIQLILTGGSKLTVKGSLTSGVLIRESGTYWDEESGDERETGPAEVVVAPFGQLATTMGGSIVNQGILTVDSSATIESQMGGGIENNGLFTLNGLCFVGGFYDKENENCVTWFSGDGTIHGGGHIVVKPLAMFGEEECTAELLAEATKGLKDKLDGFPVYTTAKSFDDLKTLNGAADVDGIYLNGASENNGIYMMGISDETIKTTAKIHVTEDLTLTKKLCLDWLDLIVDRNCTLTLPSLEDLSFVGRRTRIVVEAPDLDANAGGTLAVGKTKVLSGDRDQKAIFTVTGNITALGAAEWAVFEYPVAATDGAWYYVHGDEGMVLAEGTVPPDAVLPLLVDGTLHIYGDFTYPGSVEIRNGLSVESGSRVAIRSIDYGTESIESNAVVKGTQSTVYELEFDLNCGNGYMDRYDHLNYNEDGRIYLQADWNDIPLEPERVGYTFDGWKATSGWTDAATLEKLAAFTVAKADDKEDGWYVPVPTDFPVVMVAQWTPDGFSDVSNPGAFYYDAVYWAFNHDPQITNGASDTTFNPDGPCTRGHVVTFLWRAAGEPEPTSTNNPFTDLKETAFYYKAVLWAVEKGITTGATKTTFAPGKPCTRGQIVTFLWRFENSPDPKSSENPFGDVKQDAFYYKAVLWASESGVTSGTSKGKFSPERTCTRGQVVTFLWRDIAGKG